MYARVENDIAVEYPLYEGDLERRFPNLKFPMDTYGTLMPEGYARVYQNYVENPNENYMYTEGTPVLVNGKYVQTWNATEYTAEEKEGRKPGISVRVRNKRNKLLQETDVLVAADRWESYSAEKKLALSTYRQELRDISSQASFPFSLSWPTLSV